LEEISMKFVHITKKPIEDGRIEYLARAVREAAFDGVDILWTAILEDLDTSVARSFYRAVKLLTDGGELDAAMDIVTGLFDLCALDLPAQVDACRLSPGLKRMFLDEFLEETDEYLFDQELSELYADQNDSSRSGG
jgi:hypothetical protein